MKIGGQDHVGTNCRSELEVWSVRMYTEVVTGGLILPEGLETEEIYVERILESGLLFKIRPCSSPV